MTEVFYILLLAAYSLMPYILVAGFIGSILLTVVHAGEEIEGDGGPLWNYFGRIAGCRVPFAVGLVGFAVLLPWALVTIAYAAWVDNIPLAVGLLIGARLGDGVFSHWSLKPIYGDNPGWYTSLAFLAEALFLSCLVRPSMEVGIGIAVGTGFFATVLPSLWVVGRLQRRFAR